MDSTDFAATLAAYMDQRVNDLREFVRSGLCEFDSTAIHKSRIATRRLTAAVRLLHPVLSKSHRKAFEKSLKQLRRRLGPLRDLDVTLKLLDELPECVKFTSAVSWLTGRLVNRRDALREKLGGKSAVNHSLGRLGKWWGLHGEVEESQKAIPSLLAESVHLQLDSFAERADQLATQTLSADGKPADPHALRISGKALRYTLELADAQGHPLPVGVIKSFKKMQDELGEWHDMVVLSETIVDLSLEKQLPHHDAPLAGQILEMAKLTLAHSERAMANFSSQWAAGGAELTKSVRQAFPLTKPMPPMAPTTQTTPETDAAPTQSKTDPDPAATDETQPPEVPPPT